MIDNRIVSIVNKVYSNKLDRVGKELCNRLGLMFGSQVASGGDYSNYFKYEIVNNELQIFTTSLVPIFIDKGTKPHIIRPKHPGGKLKWTNTQSGTIKHGPRKGERYEIGSKAEAREVHHPGFKARPFISQTIHLSKPTIKKILAEDSESPALTFVVEGDNLYLL